MYIAQYVSMQCGVIDNDLEWAIAELSLNISQVCFIHLYVNNLVKRYECIYSLPNYGLNSRTDCALESWLVSSIPQKETAAYCGKYYCLMGHESK